MFWKWFSSGNHHGIPYVLVSFMFQMSWRTHTQNGQLSLLLCQLFRTYWIFQRFQETQPSLPLNLLQMPIVLNYFSPTTMFLYTSIRSCFSSGKPFTPRVSTAFRPVPWADTSYNRAKTSDIWTDPHTSREQWFHTYRLSATSKRVLTAHSQRTHIGPSRVCWSNTRKHWS